MIFPATHLHYLWLVRLGPQVALAASIPDEDEAEDLRDAKHGRFLSFFIGDIWITYG